MDRKSAFLVSVLGSDGAQALAKATSRCVTLRDALLPRAVAAWVQAMPQFEGTFPGIENTYLRFAKSEAGYSGAVSVRDQNYEFEGATFEHVAAAVVVGLGLDTAQIATEARDLDLAKLGKTVDLLVRARAVTALLKAQAEGQRHGTAAEPRKPEDATAPTAPTKQQTPPRPPEPKPKDYVPAPPRAKVQLPKVKLPGMKLGKSEIPPACTECGTRFLSASGTLRGCLCVRDLFKHIDVEDAGDHYTLSFDGALDHDEVSLVAETLGATRGQ